MRCRADQFVLGRDSYAQLLAIGNLLAFRAERAEIPDPQLAAAWEAAAEQIAADLRDSGQIRGAGK